ncbi:MAG: hypothetical protein MK085_02050 [Phycisphaerales bacterium]|nr:hypothetical protein [Phycisphaerales bacterium]
MFDFFKSKLRKTSGGGEAFVIPDDSCIRCTEDGGLLVVNLDQTGWNVDHGRLGVNKMLVPPPGGLEVFSEEELEGHVVRIFQRIRSGRGLDNVFQFALKNKSFLISMLPSGSQVRFRAFEIFDRFLKDKYQSTARDFESIKIYGSVGRPGMNRCVRKLQGGGLPQVICNFTDETFQYFHYWKGESDITIDSLFDDWPIEPEELAPRAEDALRSMDMDYFERMRTGLANGMLFLILPGDPQVRNLILGTAERVLESAPGGPIDLSSPRVIRCYRRRGSLR